MNSMTKTQPTLGKQRTFVERHIGPREDDQRAMLAAIDCDSLEALTDQAIPAALRQRLPLGLEAPRSEAEALAELRGLADQNRLFRSYLGMGYYGCVTPPAIQRHILENPRWYTPYTPYQAEISQGRLEALLTFQTMIEELTGLPLAGASLLDEATAAAEAMAMAHAADKRGRRAFFVAADCHPQTIAVVRTRAEAIGLKVLVGPADNLDLDPEGPAGQNLFGLLLQYPATDGRIADPRPLIERARAAGVTVVMAADLLALTLLLPPGALGADIAVGATQRFGMPLGYGGPHAGYLATSDAFKRLMPGRIVGVSVDADGKRALRLALQTREQHIRREKATSNICTAQVLPAVVSAIYGVYHGPDGLRAIARRVHRLTAALALGLRQLGCDAERGPVFDTLRVAMEPARADAILASAAELCINLRRYDDGSIGIALDETVGKGDLAGLLAVFAENRTTPAVEELIEDAGELLPHDLLRGDAFMAQEVFNRYQSETQLARWLHQLASRDVSLLDAMIPLGSCTMKLNAAVEMAAISWPEMANLHPFAPVEQAAGYRRIFQDLERWLGVITGLPAVSLQPNAGSQGELAGLLTIRAWHAARGQATRDICLIPTSAHGTNPASATLAGLRVVAVACDERGNIDLNDLRSRAAEHADRLAALMVTYPSTHGVFEEGVVEACRIVHESGGQVYLDGANLNALVGLVRPADLGADVCHVNLHKTFCIPHGGGGPGMGPICAAEHLSSFLPGHPLVEVGGDRPCGTISATPWGSALILPISWIYMRMMGGEGLTRATQVAILNANYMARRLGGHYMMVYTGASGRCAHEFIIDLRPFKKSAGLTENDVAKRLMDYGFHAPTMSWPVAGTLMIEPTESEPKEELDRFCDAMIAVRGEIAAIEEGRMDVEDNPLRNAPHTAAMVGADEWKHPYTRRQAAWPAPWLENAKYWPPVRRIDNAFGDRNLVCSCGTVEERASNPS
jgi:glycine dehydrogenase